MIPMGGRGAAQSEAVEQGPRCMPEGVTPAAPCCVSPMGDGLEVTGARCGGVFAGPRTLVGEDLSAGTMPEMGELGTKRPMITN